MLPFSAPKTLHMMKKAISVAPKGPMRSDMIRCGTPPTCSAMVAGDMA